MSFPEISLHVVESENYWKEVSKWKISRRKCLVSKTWSSFDFVLVKIGLFGPLVHFLVPLFSLERIIRHNLALIKLSLHQVTICLAKMTQKQTDYDGSQRKNLKYTQRNGSQIFRRRSFTKKSYFWLILRGNLLRKTPLLRFKWAFRDKNFKFFYAKFLVESLIDELWKLFHLCERLGAKGRLLRVISLSSGSRSPIGTNSISIQMLIKPRRTYLWQTQ